MFCTLTLIMHSLSLSLSLFLCTFFSFYHSLLFWIVHAPLLRGGLTTSRHLPLGGGIQLVFFSCNPDFFSSSSVASRLRVDWGVFGFFIASGTGFAFLSSAVVPEDRSVLSSSLDSSSLKSRSSSRRRRLVLLRCLSA